jgi:thiamine-phosphate pyrophosphorylase
MDPAAWRIIDANLNRAREGLRALEEHARLVLDDPTLTARLKHIRHALGEAGGRFGALPMLAARDIEHDVGTQIGAESERVRGTVQDVAVAAAKRVTEALRCIEEYGKTVDPAGAAAVEKLRYQTYAVEQDIFLGGPRRRRLRSARLHVLIGEAQCNGPWLTVCEQAVAGGADVLQLREKSLSDRELLIRARQLRTLTQFHGVLLIINDRPDIARLAGADGVHVGQDDLSVAESRHIAGAGTLVGKSAHSLEQARSALAEGPDYLAVGPMFASKTKPQAAVQGPDLLAEVLRIAEMPVVAIGGITEANASQLSGHGRWQAAVCQAVVAAVDVAAATRSLKEFLSRA